MYIAICSVFFLALSAFSLLSAQSPGNRFRVQDLGGGLASAETVSGKPRLEVFAGDLGLAGADLEGVYLASEFRTQHSGVTHFRYRQRFDGVGVHNAVYVVNVARDGRVLSRGGFLYPRPDSGLQTPDWSGLYGAVRIAALAVNAEAGASYLPVPVANQPKNERSADANGSSERRAFAPGGFGEELTAERAWVAFRGKLRPAYLVSVTDPNGVDHFDVLVDAVTSEVLQRTNRTLYFQNAQQAPEALVFDRNSPQPNPVPGRRLEAAPAFVERVPVRLAGDRVASPEGWVSGGQTAGNNTITGVNPLGIALLATPEVVRAVDGHFRFPLELGPGAPSPVNFPEAAVTNLFYWTNRAHDYFYGLGFDEAAGNFQASNYGRGGVEGDPMYAYAHFGRASAIRAQTRNAFYTSRGAGDDGRQSGIHMFLSFGLDALPDQLTDGSFDNEVIVHEYTHGVTNRLVPVLSGTFQGQSMGEAFSDYFALEMLTPEGSALDGEYAVGEYLFQRFGLGIRSFPYSTDLALNPLTYGRLGKVNNFLGIHDNGGIWMMALWEMRANLIRKLGEREGRRRAGILIIDGLKLSPPAPSMIDVRDAILLADRTGFGGSSQNEIWAAFAKRGLGVLAQTADETSGTPGTWRVRESFEVPSNTGVLGFYQDRYTAFEQLRVALYDGNLRSDTVEIALTSTSGDVETLLLTRRGSAWLGRMSTAPATVAAGNGRLELGAYDYVELHYVDHETGGAPKLVQASLPGEPFPTAAAAQPTPLTFPNERRLNLRGANITANRFALPFPFQFFGRTYNLINISTNGLLSFEPSFATDPVNAELCRDRDAFRNVTGIAPLWTDARTNGSAQANEDVYVSQSGDAITFRWVAETIPAAGVPPQPLNFAATLRDNGTIEFRYGTGNQNIATGAATVCGAGPVVGLSNGLQTLDWIPTGFFGRVNLENAPTVVFRLPTGPTSIPQMRVETPVEGETFQGVMKLDGLVWDSGSTVSRVEVLIDGRSVGSAGSVSRPDVCAAERLPGCPVVGFTTALNLVGLGIQPGPHTLQFRVSNSAGSTAVYPETPYSFVVEAGNGPEPVAVISRPADGAAVSGRVTVEGVAYLKGLSLVAVDLLVDGLTVGRATYGQAAADACAGVTEAPNCPRAGFNISWNTAEAALPVLDGERKLSLRLTDQSGRVLLTGVLATVRVENGPDQSAPTGVLESVKNGDVLEGIVTLRGWAYDLGGRVTSAVVLLNGSAVATARLGLARQDVCTVLGENAPESCPAIGFEATLDTRRYSNGPYTLGIRLLDASGNVTVIPRFVEYGINVTIRNE